ncbi:MAG: hypothetical protein IJU23_12495, partial [Proteobacteria bacterium]|nr:hypothetical protein [Pseudomonadota bacterium]
MLPLLPIGVALAAATALVKNILDKSDRKSHHTILLGRVRSLDIPVDLDGKFNPNTILPDGQPLLFNVLSEPVLLRSLLDCGANPNVCNAAGVPAIIGAQRLYNSDEVVPILLKYGA